MNLECGKLHTVDLPKGEIDAVGMVEIQHYLIWNVGFKLPHDFEWCWQTTKGTFPKRVAAFAFKGGDDKHKGGVSMTPTQMTMVGNIASRHSQSENHQVFFDFTDKIDWGAGDFGDPDSCFWGGKANALFTLRHNKVMAMRLWIPSTAKSSYKHHYKGYVGAGRCWVYKLPEDKGFLFFNGYGGGRDTLYFVRLAHRFLGLTYQKVALSNQGMVEGNDFHINNASGYYVASPDIIGTLPRPYDLNWTIIRQDTRKQVCFGCGTDLSDNPEAVLAQDQVHWYCKGCMATCTMCQHISSKKTVLVIGKELVCNHCVKIYYTTCEGCTTFVHNHNLKTLVRVTGMISRYCSECSRGFPVCPVCKTYTEQSNEPCIYCTRQRKLTQATKDAVDELPFKKVKPKTVNNPFVFNVADYKLRIDPRPPWEDEHRNPFDNERER